MKIIQVATKETKENIKNLKSITENMQKTEEHFYRSLDEELHIATNNRGLSSEVNNTRKNK